MKKTVIIITLATGLFFLLGQNAFANNLLDNPGFENGINSWDSLGPNWTPQNVVVHSGVIAAKNTISALAGQDYFASLSQVKALSAGQAVYATTFAKTNINVPSSAVAGILIEFLKSDNTLISKKQDELGGLTDWRKLYVSATAPALTAKVRLSVFVYAAQADALSVDGVAYFDDVVLSTDLIAPPPAQTTLINAGFENGLNDWNLIYAPSFSVDGVGAIDGSYSAKSVIQSIAGQDFFSSASQDLVYQSSSVWASAFVKTNMNPASTAAAGLLLEFYSATGTKIGSSQRTLLGINDWTRILIGATPPPGTATIRIHVFTYALKGDSTAIGGTANFDSIVFSYEPLPPENFQTSILNNGFENGLNQWSELYGFPSQVSAVSHSGNYSAKKTIGQIEGQDYYSQIYQDIYFNLNGDLFAPNTAVYATGYVKTAMLPLTQSKAGIQLEFIDALGHVVVDNNGHPIIINDSTGGQSDWQYMYVNGRTPLGTARVRVSAFEFATKQEASLAGDAYFDDFQFSLTPLPYVCGDADGSGDINIADAVYLINYIFGGGAAPVPLEAGDADGSREVNISDAVYLINYIFGGGPAPVCPGVPKVKISRNPAQGYTLKSFNRKYSQALKPTSQAVTQKGFSTSKALSSTVPVKPINTSSK